VEESTFNIIIIIIIKNEKIKVTLCENAVGALYIVSKMCVDGQRKVEAKCPSYRTSAKDIHWTSSFL